MKNNSSEPGVRAIILAGGKGTRLLPFTVNFPKPLVPVGDVPVIELLLRQLIQSGIDDITLSLGHLAELIKAYFSQREHLYQSVKLRFVQEEEPTGTAGSINLIPDLIDTFLVMNGDLLTNIDFGGLLDFHRAQSAVLTVATHERRVKIDLGVMEIDGDHRVTNYIEKPERSHHVSMGIYVYEPTVLKYIPRGKYLDFPDLVLNLIAAGERVVAYETDCLWLDIGRPDDYAKAQELFAEKREDFELV